MHVFFNFAYFRDNFVCFSFILHVSEIILQVFVNSVCFRNNFAFFCADLAAGIRELSFSNIFVTHAGK